MPRWGRPRKLGVGAIVALGFLCLVLLGPIDGGRRTADRTDPRLASLGSASVNVTVVPSQWWISGGNSTPVFAEWSGLSPGCSLDPLWFRWAVTSGEVAGSIAPDNGTNITFAADRGGSGTTNVTVHAAATLTCGNRSTAVLRNATASFRVDSPPIIQDLSLSPDLVSIGNPVCAQGVLAGGEPPFRVTVSWSGSFRSTESFPATGPFSVCDILSAGTYDPTVLVTDAAGLTGVGTAGTPATVGGNFAIGLVASSDSTDVGIPVTFTIESDLSAPNYTSVASCSDAGTVSPADLAGPRFSCSFPSAGVATVTVSATEVNPPYEEVSAFLLETVTPPLSIVIPTAALVGEVGTRELVPVTLLGGVPPVVVSWQILGNASEGAMAVPEDGTIWAPVLPTLPGSETLLVRAFDSRGDTAPAANDTIVVDAALTATAVLSASIVNGTPGVGFVATLLAGAPPFSWVVVSSRTYSTNGGGTLADPGSFGWNGTGTAEGTFSAVIFVVDGEGAVRSIPCSWTPTRPVSVEVIRESATSGLWSATVLVRWGISPYELWVNDSTNGSSNRTIDAPGPVNLTGTSAGNLSVTVVVVDRFGWVSRTSLEVNGSIPPVSRPASEGRTGSWLGPALLGAAGVGGLVFLLRRMRHRRGRDEATAPDPVRTLRAIIEPADGAERATVELLAEEQGVPLESVRSTLDRLVSEGRIRSERGPDGEEILAWRDA